MSHEVDPLVALKAYVAKFARQYEAAEALGITPAYLSDLLHGNRQCTDSILKQLGLRKAVVR